MSDILSIIIIGIYTLVYVIVFILQKNQIKSQKSTIASMESFMKIFKMDELTKYVNVKTEAMQLETNNKIDKFNKEFRENSVEIVSKLLNEEIKNRFSSDFDLKFNEISNCAISYILSQPIEERIAFIDENLPLTKDIFKKNLTDYNTLPTS